MSELKTVITELQDENIQDKLEVIAYSNLEIQYCLESIKGVMKEIHNVLSDTLSFNIDVKDKKDRAERLGEGDREEDRRESRESPEKKGKIGDAFAAGKEDSSFGYGSIFSNLKGSITGVLAGVAGFAGMLTGFTVSLANLVAGPFILLGKAAFAVGSTLIKLSAGLFKFVGQMAFKGLGLLINAAKAIRLFMLGTFIPGMIGAFSSIITALTPVVVAAAPFVLIGLAIGAALFGLYKLLESVTENLGFDSIGDTLKYAVLKLKDGLFSVVNSILGMYNALIGFVKKVIKLAPDFLVPPSLKEFANSGAGEAKMLDTNSAERFKESKNKEREEKEKKEREEKEKEEEDTNKPMNAYERAKARENRAEAMAAGAMAVDKDGNPVDTGAAAAVDAAAATISDERAALQEQIRALDAKVYDRATYEGLSKEEKIAKRNALMAELSELSAKNKELRNKENAAFAEVEAAENSMTFGGGDNFYAGTDGDLEDTSGMVLKSSTGGTTVTGGEETTTAVSAAQLEKDKKDVSAEQARFKAGQEAFKQMAQERLVGANEFIMDDDPRYAELQKRTEAIMSGKNLQGVGKIASLTGQLQDVTAQIKAATSAASGGTSIVAATNNNVSNATITNQTTMPMPPSTDTSDRYASQFGAR